MTKPDCFVALVRGWRFHILRKIELVPKVSNGEDLTCSVTWKKKEVELDIEVAVTLPSGGYGKIRWPHEEYVDWDWIPSRLYTEERAAKLRARIIQSMSKCLQSDDPHTEDRDRLINDVLILLKAIHQ